MYDQTGMPNEGHYILKKGNKLAKDFDFSEERFKLP